MNSSSLRQALVAGLSFLALTAGGGAHAAFRQYLSASGLDTNPCTLVAPCRLLPAALVQVDPGGEIWMLDSANYNTSPVSITKSVTILAIPGQMGSVVGQNGTAFAISAPGIAVTLQNLNILSFSNTGDIGVLVGNAAQVSIINCNIFGFKGLGGQGNGIGVWVNPGANSAKLNVVNSVIRNNSNGIIVSGNARATISKTHVLDNAGVGIRSVTGGSGVGFAVVDVTDSVSSGNGTGFSSVGSATVFSYMNVIRSVASRNTSHGFVATGGALGAMLVSDSMSTSNGGSGFINEGSEFGTRGNNHVIANGAANVVGTMQPITGN